MQGIYQDAAPVVSGSASEPWTGSCAASRPTVPNESFARSPQHRARRGQGRVTGRAPVIPGNPRRHQPTTERENVSAVPLGKTESRAAFGRRPACRRCCGVGFDASRPPDGGPETTRTRCPGGSPRNEQHGRKTGTDTAVEMPGDILGLPGER